MTIDHLYIPDFKLYVLQELLPFNESKTVPYHSMLYEYNIYS